jgi:nicotinate-nucleotide pyrophosphorylase (carboxylating)
VSELPDLVVEPVVRAALLEDFGRAGDITSAATVPKGARARGLIRARATGVVAGLQPARLAFHLVDPALRFEAVRQDGDAVSAGESIATIEGSARAILAAERVALNFLGHLSGIATTTHRLAAAIAATGAKAKLTCTRKTTPGLRALEKAAVRAGGGSNHRFGLDDAILIKDNHIAVAGGVAAALDLAREAAGHLVRIEIEVDSLRQLEAALAAGADIVLLDNFTLPDLAAAVRLGRGRAILEASGGVTLETVAAVASSGVDFISSGAITHSAPCLDIGLDIDGACVTGHT